MDQTYLSCLLFFSLLRKYLIIAKVCAWTCDQLLHLVEIAGWHLNLDNNKKKINFCLTCFLFPLLIFFLYLKITSFFVSQLIPLAAGKHSPHDITQTLPFFPLINLFYL